MDALPGHDFALPRSVGRYLLQEVIASGGMATVYKGKLDGPQGFARTVAIKRLHPHLARDADFVARFAAEARLAARIHHANVVQTLDFVEAGGERFLVLDFVEGATLGTLLEACAGPPGLPVAVAAGILLGALRGLTAAHDLCDEDGVPLEIVHRDFSPQNLIVGDDGAARVLDFGIAKVESWQLTQVTGQRAGKLSYMSPEQAEAAVLDQRSDVFSAGIVLWEALTGHRLFGRPGLADAAVLRNVLLLDVPPPSSLAPEVPPALDEVVLRALQRDPANRFASARLFAAALESATRIAASSEIASLVQGYGNTAEHPAQLSAVVPTQARDAAVSTHRPAPAYQLVEPTALEILPQASSHEPAERTSIEPLPTIAASKPLPHWLWLALALAGALLVVVVVSRRQTASGTAKPVASLAGAEATTGDVDGPLVAPAGDRPTAGAVGGPVLAVSSLPLEQRAAHRSAQPPTPPSGTRAARPTTSALRKGSRPAPAADKGPNGIAW